MAVFKKIVISIVILIIIILIIWWASSTIRTPKKRRDENKYINKVTYVCSSGNNIQAAFHSNNTLTVMKSNGKTLELKRTRSADGGRYANGNESFILWEKGSYAMITRNGNTETCINKKDLASVKANKQRIKKVVAGFGARLQQVSLLAPGAAKAMSRVYAPFVTPQLISQWKKDLQKAPGRRTSSPWPDHFVINSIQPGGVVYSVDATLVLMTSNEVEYGGNAGTKRIEMTLAKRDGKWKIASYRVKG
jgi:membrane-bound inhibitor of C-type lysozyme